ncbi:hypothetical protein O6H91_18G055200 [Diphasiastrum complanatum]|uniref:Uncharacterized protein n=1 Tax=Diphasiastrum complanatum TaxID=34168 RepID=A0ACC2B1H7_DIPCM|nr:hypothetical protein O6H91_18G055200 [Diphasiastrum complanatum]
MCVTAEKLWIVKTLSYRTMQQVVVQDQLPQRVEMELPRLTLMPKEPILMQPHTHLIVLVQNYTLSWYNYPAGNSGGRVRETANNRTATLLLKKCREIPYDLTRLYPVPLLNDSQWGRPCRPLFQWIPPLPASNGALSAAYKTRKLSENIHPLFAFMALGCVRSMPIGAGLPLDIHGLHESNLHRFIHDLSQMFPRDDIFYIAPASNS